MSEKLIVVDLEGSGREFLNKICQVIDKNELNYQQVFVHNFIASYPVNVMKDNELNNLCYKRFLYEVLYLFNQELSAIICQDYITFLTRLKTVPDLSYYKHIYSFQNEHKLILISNAFKEYCLKVYDLINRYVNREQLPCEYLISSATESYMIVSQFLKIDINI